MAREKGRNTYNAVFDSNKRRSKVKIWPFRLFVLIKLSKN